MKAVVMLAIRLLTLTIVYFVCFAAVSASLLPVPSEQNASTQGSALAALLAVSVVNTFVLAYVILRSRWAGWKLIVTIFFVFYGVTIVMPQIETAVFVTTLPRGMLPRLFLSGAIIAVLVSSLAVLILGKKRPDSPEFNRNRLNMSMQQWITKLSLIVITYLILYFTFGYFIA